MKRVFVLSLVVGLITLGWLYTRIAQPFASFPQPMLLDFPKGTATTQIADKLYKAGVVENPAWFLIARAARPGAKLQAGEYQFSRAASPIDIVGRLIRGDVHYYELVVPEGSNLFDIAKLAASAGIATEAEFLKLARDTALNPAPDRTAKSLEGYLFPATYRFTKGLTARQLCRMMTARFEQAWKDAGGANSNVREMVTLASLIEKEARVAQERPTIASVYRNRLDRGIKLDCDPTVIYAALLESKYRGTIYRSDLDRESPYNTYRVPGLPPGPIASPGLDSLRAALRPATTEFIYFVARPDGSGTHVFSKTLAEHNRAVLEYRRGVEKKDQARTTAPDRSGARPHAD